MRTRLFTAATFVIATTVTAALGAVVVPTGSASASVPGFPCTTEEEVAALLPGTLIEDVDLAGEISPAPIDSTNLNITAFYRGCPTDTKARVSFNHPEGHRDRWKVKHTDWITGEIVYRASTYAYGDASGDRANCTLSIAVGNRAMPPRRFERTWYWKSARFTSDCIGADSTSVRITINKLNDATRQRGRTTNLPAITAHSAHLHRAQKVNPCFLRSDGRRHRPGTSKLPWLYGDGRHHAIVGAAGVVTDSAGNRYVTRVETRRFVFNCTNRSDFR